MRAALMLSSASACGLVLANACWPSEGKHCGTDDAVHARPPRISAVLACAEGAGLPVGLEPGSGSVIRARRPGSWDRAPKLLHSGRALPNYVARWRDDSWSACMLQLLCRWRSRCGLQQGGHEDVWKT